MYLNACCDLWRGNGHYHCTRRNVLQMVYKKIFTQILNIFPRFPSLAGPMCCYIPTPGNPFCQVLVMIITQLQSITFEASDRSRSLPLALIHFLVSELSLAPIREIALARYKLSL